VRRAGAASGAAWLAALALALAPGSARAHEGHDDGAHHDGETAAPSEARFEPPPPGSYELPPFGQLEAHGLLGSDGLPAPLLELAPGGAALVSFVYLSCPDACPMATAVLQRVDRQVAGDPRLAGRVSLVTVSFDPARDTPAKMAAFRASAAPRGRWRFLTSAGPDEIAPVLADFGQDGLAAPAGGEAASPVSHVLKVFLVDGAGRIRNVYSTGFLDPRLLVNDLLTVVGE
jgi:cytochrome oxidase Cu insertion factor (SCO1/SenC/PrrC family)